MDLERETEIGRRWLFRTKDTAERGTAEWLRNAVRTARQLAEEWEALAAKVGADEAALTAEYGPLIQQAD